MKWLLPVLILVFIWYNIPLSTAQEIPSNQTLPNAQATGEGAL